MKISYVILTHNRADLLESCLSSLLKQNYEDLEIIVVDNASTDNTRDMVRQKYHECIYIYSEKNLGVCEGRNVGFRNSSGSLIVVIDDDCIIDDTDFTRKAARYMENNPECGVLCFKIIDANTNDTLSRHIPSTDKSIINHDKTEVSYFLGGAMAIRSQVLDQIGVYPKNYFYSMEETHLSYRIIKTKWEIHYITDLEVIHYESSVARPSWRSIYYHTRNKILLNYEFLPTRYAIINTFIWLCVNFTKALRFSHLKYYFKAIKDAIMEVHNVERQTLNKKDLKKIKSLKGRLYY